MGVDVYFNKSSCEIGRNFANKLWNAFRFLQMKKGQIENDNTVKQSKDYSPDIFDKWIQSRLNSAIKEYLYALNEYKINEASKALYDFVWRDFCDWYIELIKPRLDPKAAEGALAACRNLVTLFEAALRLLHPIMPFISEEIWQAIHDGHPPTMSLAFACYPQGEQTQLDMAAETDMAILQDLIVSVRNLRAELKVDQRQRVSIQVFAEDPAVRSLIQQNQNAVERLANVDTMAFTNGPLVDVIGARRTAKYDLLVIYQKKINLAAERSRLNSELEKIKKEIANGERQLSNEQFLAKAPALVVEGIRKRAQDLATQMEKTESQLRALGQG
jgi:valyl-tRNA synthetase